MPNLPPKIGVFIEMLSDGGDVSQYRLNPEVHHEQGTVDICCGEHGMFIPNMGCET